MMADRASLLALQLSCRGDPRRERLLRDLVSFAEARGELQQLQTLPKTPRGAPIDWLRLYEEVVARGGYQLVSRRKLWAEIAGKSCMNIDIMPFSLALHYERYLYAFEEKQVFGRDVPPSVVPAKRSADPAAAGDNVDNDDARIATASELHGAHNMGGTPLPLAPKRLKVQRSGAAVNPDLGTLHGLVLALDSNDPRAVLDAINVLSVLSYGANANANAQTSDADCELLLDGVPGLLDALYRQLQRCALLPQQRDGSLHDAPAARARRRLLHLADTTADSGGGAASERELLDARGLLLLNIVRNLSMVAANESLIADHDELVVYLILLLRGLEHARGCSTTLSTTRRRTRVAEIGDHALDVLCNIGKRIDFVALHPPAQLELWHVEHALAAHLWRRERVLPLECLLQQLARLLLAAPQLQRGVLLRVCELLCSVCRDASVRHLLAASAALRDPALLDRVVALLACARSTTRKQQQQMRGPSAGIRVVDDVDMDGDDDDDDEHDDDDADDDDDNSKWPAPWESDGFPSGVGMGVVYVSPEGTRSVGATSDADTRIDHEVRDAALEVLFRLADAGNDAKLRIAKHPSCLFRVASVLTSCIGRPEAARIAVAILSSVSMNRETFAYFLPIERALVLVACSDRSVSDILNNVVADVFGMHSL